MHDFVTPNREPVGQAINSIISRFDDIIAMANDPATYEEVAAELVALWRLRNNVSWVLMHIDETEKEKQKSAPRMRIVK